MRSGTRADTKAGVKINGKKFYKESECRWKKVKRTG